MNSFLSDHKVPLLTVTLAILAAAVFGVVQLVSSDDSKAAPTAQDMAVERVRAITAPYQDVSRALADGFIATEECVSSPEGGMGLHYVNPQRLKAPLDPEKPQVLLYSAVNGGLELTGAEWFAPDPDQNLGTDVGRPTLFGNAFQGPMAGHSAGMPIHFDLHVWSGRANPKGDFSPWNPSISCAAS